MESSDFSSGCWFIEVVGVEGPSGFQDAKDEVERFGDDRACDNDGFPVFFRQPGRPP